MKRLAEILDRLKELHRAEREARLVVLRVRGEPFLSRGRGGSSLPGVEVHLHGLDKLRGRLGAAAQAAHGERADKAADDRWNTHV